MANLKISLSVLKPDRSKGKFQGEKIGLRVFKRLNELHGSGMPVADSVKL